MYMQRDSARYVEILTTAMVLKTTEKINRQGTREDQINIIKCKSFKSFKLIEMQNMYHMYMNEISTEHKNLKLT